LPDQMVTITREESLPIVKVIIPAATTVVTSFPNQFFGRATDMRLTNLDGANLATYQINGESTPVLTLLANSFVTFGATEINLISVTAGAAGACQIEATVRKIG